MEEKQYWCENLLGKMLMNKVEIELKCYQNWLNILTSNIHFSLLWLLSSQQYSIHTQTTTYTTIGYADGKIISNNNQFFRSLNFLTNTTQALRIIWID